MSYVDFMVVMFGWLMLYPVSIMLVYTSFRYLKDHNGEDKGEPRLRKWAWVGVAVLAPLVLWVTLYFRVPQTLLSALNKSGGGSDTTTTCDNRGCYEE